MERSVNSRFQVGNKTFQVVESTPGCYGCSFYGWSCSLIKSTRGECRDSKRHDHKNVVFQECKELSYNCSIPITLEEARYLYRLGDARINMILFRSFTLEELD